jgi:uncharacterized membrane protein
MNAVTAVAVVVIIAMVVGIPLLGVTLRLSIKPLVEAWLRLRERQSAGASIEVEALKLRVAALEAMLESQDLLGPTSERRGLEQRSTGRLIDKS